MTTSEKHINVLLGMIIAERRKRLKLSQEEVARRAQHSRTYYSDIERGKRNISVVALHNIAKALETHPSRLLDQVERLRCASQLGPSQTISTLVRMTYGELEA